LNQVWVLCTKELKVALDTAQGAVIAVAFLLATGFFFGSNLFLIGQAEMRGFFSVMPLLLMFFIPAMAMRQLADELNHGTFELLATMPLSTLQLVAGKYLSILLQLMILFALTLLYPWSLTLLGDPDGGTIAAGFLALLLLAVAYSAVCLYASSLTKHAIIAYILGFALLFGMFLLDKVMTTLPPVAQDWLTMLLPFPPFAAMLRGVISLEQVAYFVCFSLFFLALTCFQLERRRWQ